jgi:predicted lipid-binding transport protein (Tim44 family)
MRKTIGLLLILGVSTLSLSGCFFSRVAGPCYGVGCPSFTSSGQPKVAAVPQPAAGNAQAQKSAAAGPSSSPAESSQAAPAQADVSQSDAAQAKPGKLTRMLNALHLHSKS